MEPLFAIKNFKKSFGDREIFDIPYAEISQDKIYAIVGPNGSGKTTILKILNALEKPTSGKVFFKGKNLYNSPDILGLQREMTMVMQNPYLFTTTVYKNIAYGLKIRNMDKEVIKKKVEEILEVVGLSHIAKRKVSNLSGGEIQRVAIARGLVIDPKVLFLDEPTAHVDKVNKELINEIIPKINKENHTTIILTTHDPAQAYLLADNVLSIVNKNITEIYYGNIFQGEIKKADGGLKIFRKNNIDIYLLSEIVGNAVISIDPRDIIISTGAFQSSARNSFKGTIKNISKTKDQIKVIVDTGLDFTVMITKESYVDMALMIGSEVFITFKSSSVQVY
ncbi:MAG TPA: ABC transporter ATP-binding protein [Desulfatiglandales bacterium]|nr:ABC transporter ATP-binding protein [Desulfatiglandales bacterium]